MVLINAVLAPYMRDGAAKFPSPVYPYFENDGIDAAATAEAVDLLQQRLDELARCQAKQ